VKRGRRAENRKCPSLHNICGLLGNIIKGSGKMSLDKLAEEL
jgi:hypothetical protein